LIDDREEGKRIFDALAEGGTVHHAYEKQFWGDWHGNLTDKYGFRWMVNCESE
jgi:PhnB protein